MKLYITKCKNCKYCQKTKSLSGMKYKCNKYNKKVNKNDYCGLVPPINIIDDLEYRKE